MGNVAVFAGILQVCIFRVKQSTAWPWRRRQYGPQKCVELPVQQQCHVQEDLRISLKQILNPVKETEAGRW